MRDSTSLMAKSGFSGGQTSLSWIWINAIGCLAGFAAIASVIGTETVTTVDRAILLSLRDRDNYADPWGPPWFEEMAAEISALGGYTILLTIFALVLITLLLLRKQPAALFLSLAIFSGIALSQVLKLFFDRPRPDLVEHMDKTFTSSFPSGHASGSMITYLTLAAVAIRFVPLHRVRLFLLWAGFFLAILIGVSRIYLGVHWPSDVVAGWLLGISWASLCWLSAHYLSRPRTADDALGHSRT